MLAMCPKCGASLLPFSTTDCVFYKWKCPNPDCDFKLKWKIEASTKEVLLGLLGQAKLWVEEEEKDAVMQKMRTMRIGSLNQILIRIERVIEILETEDVSNG